MIPGAWGPPSPERMRGRSSSSEVTITRPPTLTIETTASCRGFPSCSDRNAAAPASSTARDATGTREPPVEQDLERLQQTPLQVEPEGAAPRDGERERLRAVGRPQPAPALHERHQRLLRRLLGQSGVPGLAEREAQQPGGESADGVVEIHLT